VNRLSLLIALLSIVNCFWKLPPGHLYLGNNMRPASITASMNPSMIAVYASPWSLLCWSPISTRTCSEYAFTKDNKEDSKKKKKFHHLSFWVSATWLYPNLYNVDPSWTEQGATV
jgi:hypothetical protein